MLFSREFIPSTVVTSDPTLLHAFETNFLPPAVIQKLNVLGSEPVALFPFFDEDIEHKIIRSGPSTSTPDADGTLSPKTSPSNPAMPAA